tara:strand:- start:540 stop:737 length:198 start_codon:yes stop_codon:yes gene_type:complete
MSKVKNYYWDEAEKFVDAVLLKLKNNEINKDEAKKEILESNVALDLVDINEYNIDEVIEMELEAA